MLQLGTDVSSRPLTCSPFLHLGVVRWLFHRKLHDWSPVWCVCDQPLNTLLGSGWYFLKTVNSMSMCVVGITQFEG